MGVTDSEDIVPVTVNGVKLWEWLTVKILSLSLLMVFIYQIVVFYYFTIGRLW